MSESIDIQGGGGGLLQAAEPEGPRRARRKVGKAIGIDLGTTHSLVAIAPEGAAPCLLPGLHALAAWLFAAFTLLHVYLTSTGARPMSEIRAMLHGWSEHETNEGSAT